MGKKVSKYYFQKQIGKGASGIVYKAFDEKKSTYAIKMYSKTNNFENCQSLFMNEIKICSFVKHKNIVKNYENFQTKTNSYLVMELCNGGDLSDYLIQNSSLEETIVKKIISQVVDGMQELFRNNIIHRDLKPKNIFINFSDQLNKHLNNAEIKIGDFGISVKVNNIEGKTDILQNQKFKIEGTLPYMAPEIINRNEFSIKSEIWSLGILVYELVVGTIPFRGATRDEIRKKIEEGIYLIPKNLKLSNECIQFINSCLQYNPNNRISWPNLLKHDFLKENQITLSQSNLVPKSRYLSFSIFNNNEVPNLNTDLNQNKEQDKFSTLLTNNTIENNDQDLNNMEDIVIPDFTTVIIYTYEEESTM